MSRVLIEEGADLNKSGLFLQVVVQAVLIFWGRDLGPDPPDGEGTVQLPSEVCTKAHWEAAEEAGRWYLRLSFAGGGNGGRRIR